MVRLSISPRDRQAELEVAPLKVVELRAELTKRGLPQSGLKAELAARLIEALATEDHTDENEPPSPAPPSPHGEAPAGGTGEVAGILSPALAPRSANAKPFGLPPVPKFCSPVRKTQSVRKAPDSPICHVESRRGARGGNGLMQDALSPLDFLSPEEQAPSEEEHKTVRLLQRPPDLSAIAIRLLHAFVELTEAGGGRSRRRRWPWGRKSRRMSGCRRWKKPWRRL
jgi:hypothetical protein